ncbi:MAG: sulfite exporter TauE/SafE family protein [Bilophila sp.]
MIITVFFVGFLVGCTGMGGIILIPALVYFLSLSTHVAMGTALFSFFFSTILSSYLYIRLGHMNWKDTIPICLGGLPFAYLGAVTKAHMQAPYLNLVLALLILLAGSLVFRPIKGKHYAFMERTSPWRNRTLLLVGAGVSFIAGMTGAGGPVLSTPLMIALGIAPITAIAAGQVYSIVVSFSGSLGNLQYGAIDFIVGAWIVVVQMLGILLGVYMANRMNTEKLRILVAWVCVATGTFIFVNAVIGVVGLWRV